MESTITRHQGFKFELRPSPTQARMLREFGEFAGACGFVYYRTLAMTEEQDKSGDR